MSLKRRLCLLSVMETIDRRHKWTTDIWCQKRENKIILKRVGLTRCISICASNKKKRTKSIISQKWPLYPCIFFFICEYETCVVRFPGHNSIFCLNLIPSFIWFIPNNFTILFLFYFKPIFLKTNNTTLFLLFSNYLYSIFIYSMSLFLSSKPK